MLDREEIEIRKEGGRKKSDLDATSLGRGVLHLACIHFGVTHPKFWRILLCLGSFLTQQHHQMAAAGEPPSLKDPPLIAKAVRLSLLKPLPADMRLCHAAYKVVTFWFRKIEWVSPRGTDRQKCTALFPISIHSLPLYLPFILSPFLFRSANLISESLF